MKTEAAVNEGTAGWSPEKKWVAAKQIATAIEAGRSVEHNIEVMRRAREQQLGKVQQGVLEQADKVANAPPHVHHSPDKVDLKHVTGPGNIFGWTGDVANTKYEDLLAFANGQGKQNALKHLRDNAEKLGLSATKLGMLANMNHNGLHRVFKSAKAHPAKGSFALISPQSDRKHQIEGLHAAMHSGKIPENFAQIMKDRMANLI